MTSTTQSVWKKCSICKKDIAVRSKYFVCSVSTCQHPRTGLQFCSVECWDAHLGYVVHRESWAQEAVAPNVSELPTAVAAASTPSESAQQAARQPVRKIVEPRPPSSAMVTSGAAMSAPDAPIERVRASQIDTLVVVSKVKQFVRDRSDFNTSQCCIDALTEKVAEHCLKAIKAAEAVGRKTVMGRDIK